MTDQLNTGRHHRSSEVVVHRLDEPSPTSLRPKAPPLPRPRRQAAIDPALTSDYIAKQRTLEMSERRKREQLSRRKAQSTYSEQTSIQAVAYVAVIGWSVESWSERTRADLDDYVARWIDLRPSLRKAVIRELEAIASSFSTDYVEARKRITYTLKQMKGAL